MLSGHFGWVMKNSSTSAHIQAWNFVYFLVNHGRAEYGDMCPSVVEKQILKQFLLH
jgi:hypothetical protein